MVCILRLCLFDIVNVDWRKKYESGRARESKEYPKSQKKNVFAAEHTIKKDTHTHAHSKGTGEREKG